MVEQFILTTDHLFYGSSVTQMRLPSEWRQPMSFYELRSRLPDLIRTVAGRAGLSRLDIEKRMKPLTEIHPITDPETGKVYGSHGWVFYGNGFNVTFTKLEEAT